ncbi:DsrE family protein [Aurantibacter crassamenti]|uniref:DsrE family protein n=1 Tax=Aurantibacter crassamenti TaxID=1837375 RepID=UPI001EED29B3|nr:DsrE family protein [Aurantibacter crassamenti]
MMKFIKLALALFMLNIGFAQEKPIKVVFDVTSANTDVHKSAARHLRLMSESYPNSEFEMVIYSSAYKMVDNNSSAAGETLRDIIKNDNVSIVVCENTLKRNNKNKADLIQGVTTVPDGIYEIVAKQQLGWGYIKEGK